MNQRAHFARSLPRTGGRERCKQRSGGMTVSAKQCARRCHPGKSVMTTTEMITTILFDDPLADFWAAAICSLVAVDIGTVAAVLGGARPAGAGALISVWASRGEWLTRSFPPHHHPKSNWRRLGWIGCRVALGGCACAGGPGRVRCLLPLRLASDLVFAPIDVAGYIEFVAGLPFEDGRFGFFRRQMRALAPPETCLRPSRRVWTSPQWRFPVGPRSRRFPLFRA